MKKSLVLASFALVLCACPLYAAEISGQYVEARTCDVWTAACFANGEMNLTGKHAVIGWKIDKGREGAVSLDGLSIVAVIEATDTLGLDQTGPSKAVLLVDRNANAAQRDALVAFAKKVGGDLTKNVVAIETAPIKLSVNQCKGGGCASLDAGIAKIEASCLNKEDHKICGNEDNFYPPLTKGVKAESSLVNEHSYVGKTFNKTWNDNHRRGAYVGTFSY